MTRSSLEGTWAGLLGSACRKNCAGWMLNDVGSKAYFSSRAGMLFAAAATNNQRRNNATSKPHSRPTDHQAESDYKQSQCFFVPH